MPATTRSANKQRRQTSLEDVGAGKVDDKAGNAKKRKSAAPPKESHHEEKKAKKSSSRTASIQDNKQANDSITINRAPVLELWGSCVTQFLYPSLSWSTCLSAGGAISTITAISKGRSIGKIEKPGPKQAEEKRQKRKEKAEKENLEELEVMSFKLNLDNEGQAIVGGKAKKAGEEALMTKYGGPQQYNKVKSTFDEALESWKSREHDLDERAFGMYESFRPTVPPGQSGWGRKRQLNLETVRTTVSDG